MEAKKLAIAGKVINVTKIGSKSQAQFAAQLKANGIVLPEERLNRIYLKLRGEYKPELPEDVRRVKEEAEARAAEVQAEAAAE